MNLLDILAPQCIKAPLQSTEKRGIINELVDVLSASGKVTDAAALKDAVWAREQTRTTGIGHGLAIPHSKCAGVPNLAMAIGKPAGPVEFHAIDSKPVQLVILLASPPDKTTDHIQALAKISRYMMMESFRDRMYAATTPEEILELLRTQEGR